MPENGDSERIKYVRMVIVRDNKRCLRIVIQRKRCLRMVIQITKDVLE